MSKRQKHLLIHHILVFALHARNFQALSTLSAASALGLSGPEYVLACLPHLQHADDSPMQGFCTLASHWL